MYTSPWLALNERNYEQYQKLENWAKKKELLEKILIGNIISMSKGLVTQYRNPLKQILSNLEKSRHRSKALPCWAFSALSLSTLKSPTTGALGSM